MVEVYKVTPLVKNGVFYHADWPEGQQVVVLLTVAPGVPAGILALLQDEHLSAEVHLFEAHEAEDGREGAMDEREGRS